MSECSVIAQDARNIEVTMEKVHGASKREPTDQSARNADRLLICIGDSIEIDFPTLECGHTFVKNIGAGKCTKCNKTSCSKCLQLINGNLLCADCYADYVRRSGCQSC
ncbi:MAG: hypothetical protein HYU02_02715 [Thaumarchaeota archaeon]|nr:hypothetical protein [Nitrososphaerota archaeon]